MLKILGVLHLKVKTSMEAREDDQDEPSFLLEGKGS